MEDFPDPSDKGFAGFRGSFQGNPGVYGKIESWDIVPAMRKGKYGFGIRVLFPISQIYSCLF